MCRLKRDGGNRCAIHRHDSMAIIKYATEVTGLPRNDAEALLTELRVEGRNRDLTDHTEWSAYLEDISKKSASLNSAVIIKNLQKSQQHHSAPDKGTFYALRNLPERAADRVKAMNQHFTKVADATGRSPEEVKTDYEQERASVNVSRGAASPPEFTRSAAAKYQRLGLPHDKASVVALEKIQQRPVDDTPRIQEADILTPEDLQPALLTSDTPKAAEESPTRPESNEDPVVEASSGSIISVGYSRSDGRLDVNLVGPDGKPTQMSYHSISPSLYMGFMAEEFDAGFYRANIMGNDAYRYDTADDADAEAGSAQCPSCGQFTAPTGHVCPPDRLSEAVGDIDRTSITMSDADKETLARRLDPTLPNLDVLTPPKEIPVTDVAGERFADEQLFLAQADSLLDGVNEDPYSYPVEFVEKIRSAQWDDQMIVAGCRYEEGVREVLGHPGRQGYIEPEVIINLTQSKYRVDLETGVLAERRTYSVETLPDDPASPKKIRDLTRTLDADSSAVKVEDRSYAKDDVIFDGAISKLRSVSFLDGEQLGSALRTGTSAYGSVKVQYPPLTTVVHDDTGRELPTGGGCSVSGIVSLGKSSGGLLEMQDKRTALRCSCETYRNNYDCAHVQHTRGHLLNIAEQSQKRALKHPALTEDFSTRRYVRVDRDESGSDIAVLAIPLEQKARFAHSYLDNGTRSRVPEGVFANQDRPTLREMTQHHASLQAVRNMSEYRVPKETYHAMESARNIPVRTPVAANFIEKQDDFNFDHYAVEGDITFTADSNGSIAVSGKRLKCNCADYEQNYDCAHVRATESQFGHFVALSDPEKPLADQVVSVHELVEENPRNRELFVKAEGVAALMKRDGSSFEEAMDTYANILALKRRAFQRAEDERRVETNTYRKNKVVPREMNTFQTHTVPAAQAYEADRRYEAKFQNYREKLMSRWEDRDPSYTEDPERFYADYQAALAQDIPYAYENVLDGSGGGGDADRRVGVELEFVLDPTLTHDQKEKVLQNIADELHQLGLLDNPVQEEHHTAKEVGYHNWSFEKDLTAAGEVISPPLDDSPESWEQLKTVCDVLKKHGAKATLTCGSHVHVSTGSYGFSTAKHANLYRSVTQNEDVLYRLSTSPKTGIHRGVDYCTPNVVDAEGDIPKDKEESHFQFNSRSREAINFDPSGNDDLMKSHAEFRTWDATLDPAVIQQQIKISVAMVDAAERRTITDGGSKKPAEERSRMGDTREKEREVLKNSGLTKHTPETFMEVNQEFARFLDENFRTNAQREGVMVLFAKTKWQRSFLDFAALKSATEHAVKRGSGVRI